MNEEMRNRILASIADLESRGSLPKTNRPSIRIENAEELLKSILETMGSRFLPEYQQAVEWLTDNHQKGIMLLGRCGTGKTTLAKALVTAIYIGMERIVTFCPADELNERYGELKDNKLLFLDDIGKESVKNNYGEKSMAFSDLVEKAERNGAIIIMTSNLDGMAMKQKYGERTTDRLKAICSFIKFNGESLR